MARTGERAESPSGPALDSRWHLAEWDGARIPLHARVADRAPGEPIVLVHGQVVSSRYMVPLAEALAPHRPVYAPDLPGFGRSAKPGVILDVPQLAEALAAWMDAAGLERAALFGNSFGCQILAAFAERHPDRASALVLQGPTADPEARSAREQVFRWLVDATRDAPGMAPVLVKDYLAAGFRRFVGTFRALLSDPIEERLPRIEAPALVVRGARDPIVPQDWAERAADLLPRGELEVIPGHAHTLNFSAPRELSRVILRFLERREGVAAS